LVTCVVSDILQNAIKYEVYVFLPKELFQNSTLVFYLSHIYKELCNPRNIS